MIKIRSVIKIVILCIAFFSNFSIAYSKDIAFDTVCIFYKIYSPEDNSHLNTFTTNIDSSIQTYLLKSDYKNSVKLKPVPQHFEFKNKTYIVFSGWPCRILHIKSDKDEIVISYIEEYRNQNPDPDLEQSRPSDIISIYAIPKTTRNIKFVSKN
jgi:hypothetical protein